MATIETIKMVEETLRSVECKNLADLKRRLPRQVHHDTLKKILAYLEESNKILFTSQGIVSINNSSEQLKKLLGESKSLREVAQEVLKEKNVHKKHGRTTQYKSRKTIS